jgi:hypothetical protein
MNLQKIIVLVALLVAVVAAFTAVPYGVLILAVLGVAIGFNVVAEEHVRVLVSALVLRVLVDTFATVPEVGQYLTAVIGNVATVAAGAALMIVFRNIVKRAMP